VPFQRHHRRFPSARGHRVHGCHTFFHGHSYTGSPLACAAGIASLKIFESEPVFERITRIERVHTERLPALKNHPAVGDVRSIGTVAAVEIQAEDSGYLSKLRPFLYDYFLEKGILLRPLGNIVYILPPYVITSTQLHFIYDVITEALDRLPA
jgi:adenosylmethionine-8-amino-7-oxononanoate aminotransferase